MRLAVLLALCWLSACSDPPKADPDIRVEVRVVAVDKRAGAPVVVLEESDGDRSLPIWIGMSEARSIAAEMEHRSPPRPNTHDLAERLIDGLDGKLERVIVTELKNGIYYAKLVLRSGGHEIIIDSRPSDAIAIGLRMQVPLYARESLLASGARAGEEDPGRAI